MGLVLSLTREISKKSHVVVGVSSLSRAKELARISRNQMGVKVGAREGTRVTKNLEYLSVKILFGVMLDHERDGYPWDLIVLEDVHEPLLYRDLVFSLWRTRTGRKPRMLMLGRNVRSPLHAEKVHSFVPSRSPITRKYADKNPSGGMPERDRFLARKVVEYYRKTEKFRGRVVLVYMESDNAVRRIVPFIEEAFSGEVPKIVPLTSSNSLSGLDGVVDIHERAERAIIIASDSTRELLALQDLCAVIDCGRSRNKEYTEWGRTIYVPGNALLSESIGRSDLLGYGGMGLFYSAIPENSARPYDMGRRSVYPESLVLAPVLEAIGAGLAAEARLRPAFGERRLNRVLSRLQRLDYIERTPEGKYTTKKRPELASVTADMSQILSLAFRLSGKRLRNPNMLYLLGALVVNYQAGVLYYPREALTNDRKKTRKYFSENFSAFASTQPLETSLRAILELPINKAAAMGNPEPVISSEARRLSLRSFEVGKVIETYASLTLEKGLGDLAYSEPELQWALYYFAEAYSLLYPERTYTRDTKEAGVEAFYSRDGKTPEEKKYLLSQDLSFWVPSAAKQGEPDEHLPDKVLYLSLLPMKRPGGALGTITLWMTAPSYQKIFFEPKERVISLDLKLLVHIRPKETGKFRKTKGKIDWVKVLSGQPELPPLRRVKYNLARLKGLGSLSRYSELAVPESRKQAIERLSKSTDFPKYPRFPPPDAYHDFAPYFDTSPYSLAKLGVNSPAVFRSQYAEGHLQLVQTVEARAADNTLRVEIDTSIVKYPLEDGSTPTDLWKKREVRRSAIESGMDGRNHVDWAKVRRTMGLEPGIFELSWAKTVLSMVGARDSGTFRVFDLYAGWGARTKACLEEGHDYQGIYSLAPGDEDSTARFRGMAENRNIEVFFEGDDISIGEKDLCFMDVPVGPETDAYIAGLKRAAEFCSSTLVEGGWLLLRAKDPVLVELGKHIEAFPDMVYRGPMRLKKDDAVFFWRKGVVGKGVSRFF